MCHNEKNINVAKSIQRRQDCKAVGGTFGSGQAKRDGSCSPREPLAACEKQGVRLTWMMPTLVYSEISVSVREPHCSQYTDRYINHVDEIDQGGL